MSFFQPPTLRITSTSLLPGNVCPIFSSPNNWRTVYAVELGPALKAGEILDISFSLHCTNDAFRPDPDPVQWGVRARLSDNTSDTVDGQELVPQMRPHNIGDAAHHALLVGRWVYQVPSNIFGKRYAKLMVWFRHPDADGSQMMTCPDNNLGMQIMWHRS